MEELTLRQMQEGALNILKKLDGICREQGLRYFLFYGTLIGAIRHKGFIPWDDDLDVAMPGRTLTSWWPTADSTGRSFSPCS